MTDHPVDGTLHNWSEIKEKGWNTLLVGNGLSINVSKDFAYDSLFEEAEKSNAKDSLDDKDRAIFEEFDTKNFEIVLGKLSDSIRMAKVLRRKREPYVERFESVRTALGAAVRSVHLERWDVPEQTLAAVKQELRRYDAIFTTSYDLLIYWAIGYDEKYGRFCDCFWGPGHSFNPTDCEIWGNGRPVYYVHGALHLVVDGSDRTRKLTRDNLNLLEKFGRPIPGDPEARPLLISEGSPRDKLSAIERNDYLAHAYETLQDRDEPLVVFGHSLGAQDRHLIDAINASAERAVAISLVKKSKKKVREQQADIWGKLDTDDVYFYDASTHPLGSSALTRKQPRIRFMPWSSKVGAEVTRGR